MGQVLLLLKRMRVQGAKTAFETEKRGAAELVSQVEKDATEQLTSIQQAKKTIEEA